MGVAPGQSLYVGDAERDMQAGKQAGMIALVAGFGYLGTADRPAEWGADGFLEQPADLFGWLGAVEVGIATRALDLNK